MKALCFSLLVLAESAMADGAAAGASGPKAAFAQFVPLVMMLGIFYFLVIRPQQKKARVHDQFIRDLKRGDVVVTNAGIIGAIRTLSDKFVTLEVDEGVCLKIIRAQISENANSLKEELKAKPA